MSRLAVGGLEPTIKVRISLSNVPVLPVSMMHIRSSWVSLQLCRGAGEGEANGAAPWTNKLKTVWTTIGKIAGFEMQPMGQEQAQPPHSQPVNREALHQRMDSVDFIEDASAEPMDSPQAGQPPRFRARSAAAPVPPGPFAPSQEMLHQAYGDTFAMR